MVFYIFNNQLEDHCFEWYLNSRNASELRRIERLSERKQTFNHQEKLQGFIFQYQPKVNT